MKCERCKEGEVKYAGSNLCEDCYLDSVNLANSNRKGIQICKDRSNGRINKIDSTDYKGS